MLRRSWLCALGAIGIAALAMPAAWAQGENYSAFIAGGTMSHVNEREDDGFVYRDQAGKPEDPFVTLKKAGANYAQFDLWTGHDKFRSLEPVKALAVRAQKAGLKVSINFFYSDDYSNTLPKGWSTDMPELTKQVYGYTTGVLKALDAAGVRPGMVKIGNEIDGTYRDGFMLPIGSISTRNDDFIALLKAGGKATRDFDPTIKIQVHSAARDPAKSLAFFHNVVDKGMDCDILALSWYYPGQGDLGLLQQNLNAIAAAFDKKILVTETSCHWTDKPVEPQGKPLRIPSDFPATPEGQTHFLTTIMKEVAGLPDHKGVGLLYWPTAYVTTPHRKGGEGGTLAFWDSATGRAIPSITVWDSRKALAPTRK